jgi:hypothetical protein
MSEAFNTDVSEIEKLAKMRHYETPFQFIENLNKKELGKVKPYKGKEFDSFDICDTDCRIVCKASVGRGIIHSKFGNNKLQLSANIAANGEMLYAAKQLQTLLKDYFDKVFEGKAQVTVKSIVANKAIFLSWPSALGTLLPVKVDDRMVDFNSEDKTNVKYMEDKLAKLGGLTNDVEIGFVLYSWLRYSDQGKKVLVGVTPQLEKLTFPK